MSLARTTQSLIGFGQSMTGFVPGSGSLGTPDDRLRDWYDLLAPGNPGQEWFVEQVAIASMKIDRVEVLGEQLRNTVALKAGLFWDDDRQLDAINLGQRIAQEPEAVVNLLRRTPHGCDWLIARWEPLAKLADRNRHWSQEQMTEAQGLLGRPGNGHDALMHVDQRGLARQMIAELVERKAKVAPADAHDRAMAEADLVDVPTLEAKQLRRYENTLHGRLRWYLGQVPKLADKPPARPIEVPPAKVVEVAPPEALNEAIVPEAEVEIEVAEAVEPPSDHPESTILPVSVVGDNEDREADQDKQA